MRSLARRPPSNGEGKPARNSALPTRDELSSIFMICRSPTPAAVGFVPLRFIAEISTYPPSGRRRDRTKSTRRLGSGIGRSRSSRQSATRKLVYVLPYGALGDFP